MNDKSHDQTAKLPPGVFGVSRETPTSDAESERTTLPGEKPETGGSSVPPEVIKERVIEEIKTCYDPEIPVNIYDLGLIYDVDVRENNFVHVEMTLTSPACPVAGSLPPEVEQKVRSVRGVSDAKVEIVWDPPWTPDLMTEAAKLELGLG